MTGSDSEVRPGPDQPESASGTGTGPPAGHHGTGIKANMEPGKRVHSWAAPREARATVPAAPAGSSLSLSESGGGPDDGSESAGESDPDSGSPADSDVPNLKFTARWPPTGPVH